MNGFRRICEVLIGLVFFVAGTLKLMDPVGSGLIVDEYIKFFHLGFILFASRFLACALALFECVLGSALIAGVWRKAVAMISGITIIFFTIITLILFIAKPAMDCGCFGEFIHLGHGQTLLKNLILAALWLLAFMPMRNLGEPQRLKYVSFGIAAFSSFLFLLYSVLSIPLRDYTDFQPGNELEAFYFSDASGEYADSLAMAGKVMIVSAYEPARLKPEKVERIAEFLRVSFEKGYTPLFLTASTPEDIASLSTDPVLLAQTYFADRKLLMTFNRANGGATMLTDGQIIRKWSGRSLPSASELDAINEKAPMDYMVSSLNRTRALFQGYLIYVLAVLMLL
ncbi:MAG: DUF417 family protein [Bacteroidales bacterium]|nr:DUF417 family protein [Bacteroidales bacterium]